MNMGNMKTKRDLRPSSTPINEQPTLFFPAVRQRPADLHFPAQGIVSGRRFRPRRLAGFLLLALLLVCAVLGGRLGLFYTSPALLPGTQVLGVDVGGLSLNETAVILGAHWQQNNLILENEQETWSVSPEALGLQLDALVTAEQAHAAGRSPEGVRQYLQTGKIIVAPVVMLDTAVTTTTLQTIAPELERAPVNASANVVNGRAEANPPVPGLVLDVAATVAYLRQNQGAVLVVGRLPLSTIQIQPAITDISGVIAELNQLLNRSLIIYVYDPVTNETLTWNIMPAVWGQWVAVDVKPNETEHLRWTLNTQMARSFLNDKSAALGERRYLKVDEGLRLLAETIRDGDTAVSLRIHHTPSQYSVQPGDSYAVIGRKLGIPYPWIQQANPGVTELSIGQTITIPSPDDLLPYPVVPHKRIIVSLTDQTVQVFENGQMKWDWAGSTGIVASPTAPGIFQVQTHVDNAYAANWNLWMPHFMGIYRPVPTSDFMNGFHGFPTRDGYKLLWTNNLGSPVTYGCVLLSNENAQALYDWAEEGVVVEIRP
ncbi:MAG: L,D-transpeptidase family protein [Chloroflexi bacterium]|nr:L,D-transpeptidase family protein [Chloroflexota bacterium]